MWGIPEDLAKSSGRWKGELGENYAIQWLRDRGYEVCRFPFEVRQGTVDGYSMTRTFIGVPPPKLWFCEHLKCKKTRFESSLFCKHMKDCPKAPLPDNDGCPCLLAFPEICDYCGLQDCAVSKIFHLIKKYSEEDRFTQPDFIVHKNGQTYFVEVKTDGGTFTSSQINFLREVKNIGLDSFTLRVDLDINYKITKKEL